MDQSTSAVFKEECSNETRILIVEDEGIPAKGLEKKLTYLGYTVCGIAVSGEEAITKALETHPDLVLMDIVLKGNIDGIEAAKRIHSSTKIPIVYLTAHSDKATLTQAMVTEPMGYLVKPIEETALRTAIEIAFYKENMESARKRAEAALAKKSAELAVANEELEQFNYIASHDLREPLRTVRSFVKLLVEGSIDKLDNQCKEFAEFAINGVERMDSLITSLLTYSTMGRKLEAMHPVATGDIVDLIVDSLQVTIKENQAQVTHEDLPLVLGHPHELTQLFQNLIVNAIKFRSQRQPPKVHVSAALHGDKWLFSVTDNGIGIDPIYAVQIFLMFKRLHGVCDQYPGTGLGLAICKKIVERHGGHIWVESQLDSGSNFLFELPAAKEKPV